MVFSRFRSAAFPRLAWMPVRLPLPHRTAGQTTFQLQSPRRSSTNGAVSFKSVLLMVLLAGVLGLAGWWWWPNPPAQPAADVPVQASSEDTTEASDALPGGPGTVGAGMDPATVQAALQALVQLEQQQQAQMAEDARIDRTVMNNLRQLAAGANEYFLEMGFSSVASVALVGTNSSQYVKTFYPVAGETYPAVILMATPIQASGVAGARDISISP